MVTEPAIGYDSNDFTPVASGWTRTIPTTPIGANIFTAPVRYRVGIAGATVEGVILSGTIPGTVTPPSTQSYSMSYGLTSPSPNYVIAATQTANAIDLATGAEGNIDFTTPPNTCLLYTSPSPRD